jgi:integrase
MLNVLIAIYIIALPKKGLQKIIQLLGHSDIKTTIIYAKVSRKELGEIVSPFDKILNKLTINSKNNL